MLLEEVLSHAGRCRWSTGADPDRQFRRRKSLLRGQRQRREQTQAIARSRGGQTTKIHALTDRHSRSIAFLLTGGNVADCTARHDLLKPLPKARILHADKGFDSNAV